MSIFDSLKELLGLRKPTKEDMKMASKEMDLFMRRGGYVPYRHGRRRFVKRKKSKDGEVKTVGEGKIIE